MGKYYLNWDEYRHYNSNGESGYDHYSESSIERSNYRIEETSRWHSTELNTETPDANGDLHVVFAIYSSGSTFGHEEDAYLNVLFDTNDHDLALDFYKKVNELINKRGNSRDRGYDYNQQVTLKDGSVVDVYMSWEGYFESLSEIRFETLSASGENGRVTRY